MTKWHHRQVYVQHSRQQEAASIASLHTERARWGWWFLVLFLLLAATSRRITNAQIDTRLDLVCLHIAAKSEACTGLTFVSPNSSEGIVHQTSTGCYACVVLGHMPLIVRSQSCLRLVFHLLVNYYKSLSRDAPLGCNMKL